MGVKLESLENSFSAASTPIFAKKYAFACRKDPWKETCGELSVESDRVKMMRSQRAVETDDAHGTIRRVENDPFKATR